MEIHSQGAKGLQLTVKTPHATFPVTVPAPGEHMIYPVLMACAIGERFGLTPEQMQAGVASFVPTKMRMNVLHQGDLTILDDGYNANPQSMKAALEILSQTEGTYRAAVLGDMFELGELAGGTSPEHGGVGRFPGKHRRPAGRGGPGLEHLRRRPGKRDGRGVLCQGPGHSQGAAAQLHPSRRGDPGQGLPGDGL